MPRYNGTGPWGMGARTGRRRGWCGRRRGRGFGARLLWPLAAIVVGDLSRPNGRIRTLLRALLGHGSHDASAKRRELPVRYRVLEERPIRLNEKR